MEQSLFDTEKPDSDGQNLREQLRPLTECCPSQTKFAGNARRSRRNVARSPRCESNAPISPLSQVFNEDCMVVMKRYPDKYFDLAVVDPPYGIKRFEKPSGRTRFKSSKMMQERGLEWDRKPDKDYFNELFRVARWQIIFGANNFELPPTEYFLIWNKMQTVENFATCEYAWTNYKMPAKMFDYSVQRHNQTIKIHPTQKPIELYEWIYSIYALGTGYKILDTHLGSGSSRIAAYKAKLSFTGCELNKEYYEAQEARFKIFVSQGTLF